MARQSKHNSDHIASILGLAGVIDFMALTDGSLEASTIEFVKRPAHEGLRDVVFRVNDVL